MVCIDVTAHLYLYSPIPSSSSLTVTNSTHNWQVVIFYPVSSLPQSYPQPSIINLPFSKTSRLVLKPAMHLMKRHYQHRLLLPLCFFLFPVDVVASSTIIQSGIGESSLSLLKQEEKKSRFQMGFWASLKRKKEKNRVVTIFIHTLENGEKWKEVA